MLGSAVYSIDVPQDSVVQYKAALKAATSLVMAHVTTDKLDAANPTHLGQHTELNAADRENIGVQATS